MCVQGGVSKVRQEAMLEVSNDKQNIGSEAVHGDRTAAQSEVAGNKIKLPSDYCKNNTEKKRAQSGVGETSQDYWR